MAEWVYDKSGKATIILDDDCFRNSNGQVIAWISGTNIYSLQGKHIGWFEHGVIRDSNNSAIGFIKNCGSLPSRPGLGGTPGMPGFSGRPGRPGFAGTPGKPGKGGWSNHALNSYF